VEAQKLEIRNTKSEIHQGIPGGTNSKLECWNDQNEGGVFGDGDPDSPGGTPGEGGAMEN